MEKKKSASIEPVVFIPPLLVIIGLVAWVVSDPASAGATLSTLAFGVICADLGWFFELFVFMMLALCIFLCIHPVGKMRFGTEAPEYTTFSWLGMIFTAIAGFGVLTWTTIEWFYYYQTPTEGVEPYSVEALYKATAYPLHHWGFVIQAAATLMGVIWAYQLFCKKAKDVRPSTACASLIGEKNSKGIFGKVIDALLAISILTAVVTSVGVNVPTMFAIIGRCFGTQMGFFAEAVVILLWSVVMALLLYTGLSKGVKYLSDFRVVLGFGLVAFLLIVGPTSYILNATVDNIGMYLQNIVRLTFNTDTFAASGTPQNWTVFYWCWYLTQAICCGIFFAKISRGRTVRQTVIGALAAQTLGSWLFFGVFQNYSIYIHMNHQVDLASIIATSGQGEAIVALWDYIPFIKFLYPILMVYGFLSMQTLLNGNVYSMALVTTKDLKYGEEPPNWNKIFWSLGIGAIAIALLLCGGISAAQAITIIGAVPAVITITLVVIAFFREIGKKWTILNDDGTVQKEIVYKKEE